LTAGFDVIIDASLLDTAGWVRSQGGSLRLVVELTSRDLGLGDL
jgi:hypothetical protein